MSKKFFNNKELCIYASELSNLIEVSKFKPPATVLMRIWEKNFPQDYNYHKQNLLTNKIEVNKNDTSKETFNKFKNSLSKKKQKEVCINMEKCLEAKNVNSMINQRRELLKEVQELPSKDKEKIKKSIIEMTNTNFGIKNENKSIHIYTQLTGIPVLKLNDFFRKQICKDSGFSWFIGGRIDGILENRTIIEVKNRMHKLFNKVKDYEKVQTYCYMYILESNISQIVETYMNNRTPETGILEIEYEENYWEFILNRILIFIDYFNKFIKSSEMKNNLLINGIENYEMDIYNSNFI
jgi:hypothetical protein